MQVDHPLVQGAINRLAAACENHGKWWGMPTGTPEAAQKLLDRGARMITCTGDHSLLVNGLVDAQRRCRELNVGAKAGN